MAQKEINLAPQDWRNRLRGDPGDWLLDADDNPSVYFWFQRDIVGRPEDSPALVAAREKILDSPPVQKIFAAQNPLGYWDNPSSLDTPRYRATAWTLALLAELGVSPASRRARAACEFVLQNYLQSNGIFSGVTDQSVVGVLTRALNYFLPGDPRLKPIYTALIDAATRGEIFALGALAEMPRAWRSPEFTRAVAQGAEHLLNQFARDEYNVLGAFPPFEPRDAFLALRVLARLGLAPDARGARVIEKIWGKQNAGARWDVEKDLSAETFAHFDANALSKWATLAVLRIVTRLNFAQVRRGVESG